MKEDKKLLNLLPKPLRQIVRIAVAVCGIDIVGVILALTAIVSKKDFFDQYYKFLISLLIFMISSLIIGLLLIAIALSIEILRIKPFKEDFDKNLVNCTGNCTMIQENVVNGLQCLEQIKKDESHIKDHVQTFTQHLDKLESVITGLDMAGRIINKRKLMEIEDSICPGAEIIILSSKYKLDEEYKSLIVNNIKKGVTYKYIVAGIKEPSGSHVHFLQTVDSWYQEYQSSLDNEKVPTATLKKTKRLNDPSYFEKKFYDHVKEYCSPFSYNTLTIMLYQERPGSSVYQVIVNLPAENDGYYSYILPKNHVETNIITEGVISMCSNDKEWNYRSPVSIRKG